VDWKCVTNGLECVLCVWAFASPIGMYTFARILCYGLECAFCAFELFCYEWISLSILNFCVTNGLE